MPSSPDATPLTVRCQCGYISFPTPTPRPTTLYHCHCVSCQLQSGSAFGTSAIFPTAGLFPLPPSLSSRLKVFRRPTNAGRSAECYFCPECGCRVMHRIVGADGTPRASVSVKGGCVAGLEWEGAAHIFVREAVLKIPREWEQYEGLPPWIKMD
ncbi:Mss4-like protein [Daldinia bambusicola]|nr:Mss4-like protein [Daldinia bambusicola]